MDPITADEDLDTSFLDSKTKTKTETIKTKATKSETSILNLLLAKTKTKTKTKTETKTETTEAANPCQGITMRKVTKCRADMDLKGSEDVKMCMGSRDDCDAYDADMTDTLFLASSLSRRIIIGKFQAGAGIASTGTVSASAQLNVPVLSMEALVRLAGWSATTSMSTDTTAEDYTSKILDCEELLAKGFREDVDGDVAIKYGLDDGTTTTIELHCANSKTYINVDSSKNTVENGCKVGTGGKVYFKFTKLEIDLNTMTIPVS